MVPRGELFFALILIIAVLGSIVSINFNATKNTEFTCSLNLNVFTILTDTQHSPSNTAHYDLNLGAEQRLQVFSRENRPN